MVLAIAVYLSVTLIASLIITNTVKDGIENNPLTTFIDEWNGNITRKEIEHHKPKPNEVAIVENRKFKITTKDGMKKTFKIIDEITKKRSVLVLLKVSIFGVILSTFDFLTE